MGSSLHRVNFNTDEEWRNAVRISANAEFCKSSGCICPLYNFLEKTGKKYRCDCQATREKLGLLKCDKTVAVCPVRNIGWPEHTDGQLARYSKRSQASKGAIPRST
jgi:hypothetical protein